MSSTLIQVKELNKKWKRMILKTAIRMRVKVELGCDRSTRLFAPTIKRQKPRSKI